MSLNSSPTALEQIRRIARDTDPLGPAAGSTSQFLNRFPVFYTSEDEARDMRRDQVLPSDMSMCDTQPTAIMQVTDETNATTDGSPSATQTEYSTVNLYFTDDKTSTISEQEVDTSCITMRS